MEIVKLKNKILSNLESLEKDGYRGRVETFNLWMKFAKSIKGKADFNELYKKHQAALQRLIDDNLVVNVSNKPISSTLIELSPKGREKLDEINKNIFKKVYKYFEPQVKSELVKYIFVLISFIVGYLFGVIKPLF